MSSLASTLSTGLSGLDVNQTSLNVIGNNIANINTTSFKASQALFTPQFYVTEQSGTAPNATFGGSNPSQMGLGAQVSAIETDFSPGTIETTGINTDMAIDGTGFFVLQTAAGQQYTRDGAFTLNSNNQLVTSGGALVQAYGVDTKGNVQTGSLQNITVPLGQTTAAQATQNVSIQGNLNAGGNIATGASILVSQALGTVQGNAPTATTNLVDLLSTGANPAPVVNAGDVLTLAGTRGSAQLPAESLTVTATTTVGDLMNFLNGGLGIDTGVNPPNTPPPGATLQTSGNTAQLTVIGNVGTANMLSISSSGLTDSNGTSPFVFTSGSFGTFTDDPTGESTSTTITAYDSLGTAVTVNVTATLESSTAAGQTWNFIATSGDNAGANTELLGNGTLTFSNTGALVSSTGTSITLSRGTTGALSPLTMNLNFGNVTDLASSASQIVMGSQDGSPIGTLNSFSVGQDGTVTGSFTNGITRTLGQLALATFNNPQGLVNQGGNSYTSSGSSGVPIITSPGTLGTGLIRSGSLESSNVDLSTEFTDMIIASTGFSAASRVISTSDQLITDLLNSQH